MATNTTNFNLSKPAYTDTADINVINGNMDKVDTALQGLGTGLAIISKANTHAAILAGQYVYVHGHNTLSEGLYIARSNISANGNLTTSNTTAVTGGGLNSVVEKMGDFVRSRLYAADDTATFTINFSNNARHFIVITGANSAGRALALIVSCAGDGTISVLRVAQGTTITYDTSVPNQITVTQNTSTRNYVADFSLSGEDITVTY